MTVHSLIVIILSLAYCTGCKLSHWVKSVEKQQGKCSLFTKCIKRMASSHYIILSKTLSRILTPGRNVNRQKDKWDCGSRPADLSMRQYLPGKFTWYGSTAIPVRPPHGPTIRPVFSGKVPFLRCLSRLAQIPLVASRHDTPRPGPVGKANRALAPKSAISPSQRSDWLWGEGVINQDVLGRMTFSTCYCCCQLCFSISLVILHCFEVRHQ